MRATALIFGGYNAERVAKKGYDVRTDVDGWQYAMPIGTPNGSLEGAMPKYNPTTDETRAELYSLNGLLGTALADHPSDSL
ncbi:hypothetical protein B0H03_101247 [Rathayibacter iranicus NCPPB 2253 = VKM Ac-1602]|uniref:Uncharacterized protein n=1 Tax=Rathayibacter iranicus NCPPB 2253 = VKM Ac-1602 TaxID=1328868 RepID=A0ABX5LKC7_9MICO|nr:hypothetical protein B0H03_101247 [Rathayibacter iranicus NCPPB 2253 = VKM Ac-1602]